MSSANIPLSTNCIEVDVINDIMWNGEILRQNFEGPQEKVEERPRLHVDVLKSTKTIFPNIWRDDDFV